MNLRKEIETAMLDLIDTNRLDSITIQMVCEKADVSKTSFYRYYQDKYDLVNRTFDRILPEGLDQLGKNIKWSEALNLIFDALGRRRNFLRQAYGSDDANSLGNHTEEVYVKLIKTLLLNKAVDVNKDEFAFSIKFFSISMARFTKDWVQKGGSDTKENLIKLVAKAAPFVIYPYLD